MHVTTGDVVYLMVPALATVSSLHSYGLLRRRGTKEAPVLLPFIVFFALGFVLQLLRLKGVVSPPDTLKAILVLYVASVLVSVVLFIVFTNRRHSHNGTGPM